MQRIPVHAPLGRNGEAGETLLPLIVSISLATVVFAATMSSFFDATKHGFDQEVRLRALEEATAVLDLMAYDLRMLGSGMPLGQSGGVPLPMQR